MSNYPQLDEAFQKLVKEGVPIAQIKADARAQGWTDAEIDAALSPATVSATQEEAPIPAPESQPPKKKGGSKGGKIVLMFVVLLILLGMGGFAAWAYVTAFNPFAEPPYTEDKLLSQYLEKMESMQSGEWKVRVDVYTEGRDEGALPFTIEAENYEEFAERYGRDYERLNTLTDILSSLRYIETEKYPTSLQELQSTNSETSWPIRIDPDPLTKQPYAYAVNADGSDFTLTCVWFCHKQAKLP